MQMNAVRALRHRNFRLFFCGQSLSLIGTWMTRLATSWLVYRLTRLGVAAGCRQFRGADSDVPPGVRSRASGWTGGTATASWCVTQILAAIQSLALAALTLSGHHQHREILWLSVLQGLINAFDMPARQSFLVQMVDGRTILSNAIALNSSMVNAARLVGPALAGMIIAAVGEGDCFLIDGISYIAVIVSLLAMRIHVPPISKSAASMFVQLKEGWTYVAAFAPIRTVLVSFAIISFMGVPYMVLMPVFAAKILGGGPHTLGFLTGAAGVGSIVAAVSLAARKSVRGLYRVIPTVAAIFGGGLIAFSFSRNYWLSLALMCVTGFGMIQFAAASNTVIQTIVDDDKRGRVDELLHDGVHGRESVRKSARGEPCAGHWRAGNRAALRPRLRGRGGMVLVSNPEIAAGHTPDLSAAWHSAGRGRWEELTIPPNSTARRRVFRL